MDSVSNRFKIAYWQVAFIVLSTAWLWAPALNPVLSHRTSLISQFESPGQPYAWLFRVADIAAGAIISGIALYLHRTRKISIITFSLLLIFGIGSMLDALIPVSCEIQAAACKERFNFSFYIHATETVVTAGSVFFLSLYDWISRKNYISAFFTLFQVAYGLLLYVHLSSIWRLNTLTQFVYQILIVLWVAWYVTELFQSKEETFDLKPETTLAQTVKFGVALWAAANGVLAIVLSIVHLHLFGIFNSVYFANDTAWLAQHGVIVGVSLLYISRHLARGEHRARQIFLWLIGLEALKYAVIVPQPTLLALYSASFLIIFIAKPFFNRSAVPTSWQIRLRDFSIVLGGVVLAIGFIAVAFAAAGIHFRVVSNAFRFFVQDVFEDTVIPRRRLRSSLLAHTISALGLSIIWFGLWSLFRPAQRSSDGSNTDLGQVRRSLEKYANSSEDNFKLWPPDKQYFWDSNLAGFVAYRVVGSVAFALADPITSPHQRRKLLNNFIVYCRSNGWRACFLLIQDSSLAMYEAAGLNTMPIGASAVVDVSDFANTTIHDKWWRWKLNRGKKQGFTYHLSTPPHDKQLLKDWRAISDQWLQRPGHQEQGFALGYFDETYLQQCSVHYLTNEQGKMAAFTNEVPIFGKLQQTTVDLIRFNPEAEDAMPYLLANVIQEIANEKKFGRFDLGFVPLAQLKGRVAQLARVLGRERFSMSGLEQFKNKFDPNWEKNYLAYDGDIADLAIAAIHLEKVMQVDSKN